MARRAAQLPGVTFRRTGALGSPEVLAREVMASRALPKLLSGHLLRQPFELFVGLIVLAAVLDLAAATGLAFVAGFDDEQRVLNNIHWGWLAAVAAALVISFGGYFLTYRGIFEVRRGGPLSHGQLAAVVVGTFGGFVAFGGSALDSYALAAAGVEREESRIRAAALGGLEQGALAVVGTGAAIAVLVQGLAQPTPDFTIPWAVLPVPGFALAFWLAERTGDGRQGGWRERLAVFRKAILLNRELFLRPHRHRGAMYGMVIFWVAEATAIWAALAMFGTHMDWAALFVGFATGTVFSRRTGPLAGAGVLMLILPATIAYSGAPLAAAVAAVFVHRVGAFWLPVPIALAHLPTLHRLQEIAVSATPERIG
jgi:uncharacterized membrane protein YbhN (UPF0104 family)